MGKDFQDAANGGLLFAGWACSRGYWTSYFIAASGQSPLTVSTTRHAYGLQGARHSDSGDSPGPAWLLSELRATTKREKEGGQFCARGRNSRCN